MYIHQTSHSRAIHISAAAYNKATQGTEANPIYLGDHEHGHNQSRGGRGGNGRPQVYYVDEPGPAHADRRFVDGRNQQHLDYRNQQHQDSRAQQHHYHGDQHYGRPPHYNVEQHGHNYGEAMHSRPHYGHGHCFICGKGQETFYFICILAHQTLSCRNNFLKNQKFS